MGVKLKIAGQNPDNMKFGDHVEIKMLDKEGFNIFGTIHNKIVKA